MKKVLIQKTDLDLGLDPLFYIEILFEDTVRYSLLEETNAVDFFYLNPETGELFLTRRLDLTTATSFSLTIRASDQRIPERTDTTTVVIRVSRNQFEPVFFNTPYRTTVQETRLVGSTVFAVEGADQDLRGNLVYESIGLYPAQSFFQVNSTTGVVTITQSLKNDGFARDEFILRVICYDSLVSSQRATADVSIAVIRNVNSPLFSSVRYTKTIPEDFAQNTPVLSVSATDADNDTITYAITRDNSGGNALSYFFIELTTGQIFLRQPLLNSGIDQFSFTVTATDSGRPSRSNEVECLVFVERDEFSPVFLNTPYSVTITELAANNSIIYSVTAQDRDQLGELVYVVVGVPPAPSFFSVNPNGGIVVRGDLRTDRSMDYVLRLQVYDSAKPTRFDEEDVRIAIRRNVNPPIFTQQTYSTRISERARIGASVISVSATDNDGDRLYYSLLGDDRCESVFYLGPDSGILYLKEPLLDGADNAFTCTLSVTDRGYPVPQTDSTTVVVSVDRDTSLPVFTNNARYEITIPENTDIGSSLLSVRASRNNIIGRIFYEVVGDYPAPSFFTVQNQTGAILVSNDLRTDNLGLVSYVLRVKAYDTGASNLASNAEVFITVVRNLNRPVFNPARYFVTIREDDEVGSFIQKLTVSDPDGNKVTCSMTGTALALDYFAIDADTCLVRIKAPLTDDFGRNTEYTITVNAQDNVQQNQQFASAEVIVTVLRDLFTPQFTNLPTTINLEENNAINQTVFTASATDSDLEGSIRYEVIGLFPSQSFFDVDPISGVVILRNSLMSDAEGRTSYTVRLQAYDTAYPASRAQADLTILVIRNKNGPVFQRSRYEFTIADTFPLGDIIGTVVATDADVMDQVTFASLASGEAADLFFLNQESGSISLKSPLLSSALNQYAFEVEASDNRASSIIKRSRATVTITILRDSGPPVFRRTPYIINVPITQQINSSIFSVEAIDPDLKGVIQYRLDGFQPGTLYFNLDKSTGSITVKQSLILDTDVFATYTLLVTAFDSGMPEIETTETVQINVLRNLFAPEFSENSYSDSVYDFQPVGTSILQVSATDQDITNPENSFVFEIDGASSVDNFFAINPYNGLITVNKDLSESTPSQYSFRVVARDLGNNPRESFVNVFITILRNEGRPQFIDSSTYDITVSEVISVLETILKVSATDPDPENIPNGQVSYSIVGPAAAKAFFQIEPFSGIITARVSLTTAPDDSYRLTVRASDSGVFPQTVEAIATIRIRREGNPFFPENEYSETRSETTPVNSNIIQLQATDPLNKELLYEITGDGLASTLFKINPNTGLITLAKSLESDESSTYVIKVSAYRAEDFTVRAQTIVYVTVTRNANPPRFLHGNLEYTISEDQPLGVAFGQVNATDADSGDNGIITYAISAQDSNPQNSNIYFYINPVTGVLAVSSNLRDATDRPVQYSLSIVVTDNGFPRLSTSVRVTVFVVRNRFGPEFRQDLYEIDISENVAAGTSLLSVVATEQEGDSIVYALLGTVPASLYFTVNPNTGVIRTNGTIVFDTTVQYRMTVQATDIPNQAASPRTALAVVIINVARNPNAPKFTQSLYNLTISEYISVQTPIATVQATDADPENSPSGTIVYSITNIAYDTPTSGLPLPNGFDFFVISPSAGIVYLAQLLTQYSVPDRFIITIQAADSAIPAKTASASMEINIVRNIHRPMFTELTYGATIDNTWNVGRPLFTVTARDDDIDVLLNQRTPNADFEYVIDPEFQVAASLFDVTQDGIVFVKESLINEERFSYFFYIIAIDKSWNPLSSRAPVTVNVTQIEVGERRLGFSERVIAWNLDENSDPQNTPVLPLTIENADSTVRCTIVAINRVPVSGSNLFAVRTTTNGRNCELYIIGNLDHEIETTYNITIGVTTLTVGRRKRQIQNVANTWNEVSILLTVNDVNDNAPAWVYPVYPVTSQPVYVFAIGRRAATGSRIGIIEATDADTGIAGEISYSLSSFSQNIPLFLASSREILTQGSLFNVAEDAQFAFTVTANDNAPNPLTSRTSVFVNVIEDYHRFNLVIDNAKPEEIVLIMEDLRQTLQDVAGNIVIIETIRPKLLFTGNTLSFDSDGTDLTFVVADTANYNLYRNTDLNLVTDRSDQTSLVKQDALNRQYTNLGLTIKKPIDLTAVVSASEDVIAALQLGAEVRTMQKSYVWWTDDPWAAFVALGGVVFILGLVALLVLRASYVKYSSFVKRYKVYQTSMAGADFTEPPSFLREYETQSLNMYVPPDETVQDLGEINMNFQGGTTPRGGGGAGTVMNPVYGKSPTNSRDSNGHREGTTLL